MRRAVVLSFRAAGHVPAVMVGQLLLKEWEMPPARNCATLIALVLWMAACVVAAVSWPIASRAAAERDGVVDHTPVSSALAAKGGQTSKEARNRARNQARNRAEAQARNQAETEAGTLAGTLGETLAGTL
ncbi:MAG: hypothetical protein J2P51_18095, partial [Hyphomicrobiaceae bacterium]|nr:hypothetical protein [Hyphomicrobiaceae bacterium]